MDNLNRFAARPLRTVQALRAGPPQLPVGLLEFSPRTRVTPAKQHPLLSILEIVYGNFLLWILCPSLVKWTPGWTEGETEPHSKMLHLASLHRSIEEPSLIRRRLKKASLVILFLLLCHRRPINRLRTRALQLLFEGHISRTLRMSWPAKTLTMSARSEVYSLVHFPWLRSRRRRLIALPATQSLALNRHTRTTVETTQFSMIWTCLRMIPVSDVLLW